MVKIYFIQIHFCIFLYLQKELLTKKDCPHMCAYKLVTVKFKWWGLQNKVENFIQKVCLQSVKTYQFVTSWSIRHPGGHRWTCWPAGRLLTPNKMLFLQDKFSYFPFPAFFSVCACLSVGWQACFICCVDVHRLTSLRYHTLSRVKQDEIRYL